MVLGVIVDDKTLIGVNKGQLTCIKSVRLPEKNRVYQP